MKRIIMQTLEGCWEKWEIEVPDGTTEEDLKSGKVEPEYLECLDSDFKAATIHQVFIPVEAPKQSHRDIAVAFMRLPPTQREVVANQLDIVFDETGLSSQEVAREILRRVRVQNKIEWLRIILNADD